MSDDCGGVVSVSADKGTLARLTAMYAACDSTNPPIAYVRGTVTIMAKAGNSAQLVVATDGNGVVVNGWVTP